jgi:hypothetical protein
MMFLMSFSSLFPLCSDYEPFTLMHETQFVINDPFVLLVVINV